MRPRSLAMRIGLLACGASIYLSGGIRPSEAAQLKVIIATDQKESEVGADMRVNQNTIGLMLRLNMPKSAYEIHQVDFNNFTAAEIMAEIARLDVDPDDAVLFYYSGHGAYDPARKTYVLASGDGGKVPLFLSQIEDAIEAKRARSVTVIADCCNTVRPIKGTLYYPAPPRAAEEVSPLFNALFFKSRGTFVVESSAPGEYALVEPKVESTTSKKMVSQNHGSLFTNSLMKAVLAARQKPNLGWTEICRLTQAAMDKRYAELCPEGRITLGTGDAVDQAGQNITAWSDGEPVSIREN